MPPFAADGSRAGCFDVTIEDRLPVAPLLRLSAIVRTRLALSMVMDASVRRGLSEDFSSIKEASTMASHAQIGGGEWSFGLRDLRGFC